MATVDIEGGGVGGTLASPLGSALSRLLLSDQITPGDDASYELCKLIWLYHPFGSKMVDAPIKQAMAQGREITVPNSPEDRVVRAFREAWEAINGDDVIAQTAGTARAYGVASVVYGAPNYQAGTRIDPWKLSDAKIYFNVLDPLNTAGSLVLNQDPNAPDFQKWDAVTAGGKLYHRSRTCVLMNERPVYLAYTSSAYGYSGRSVYQRALYPLKSFLQTMITDDMVSQKAGLLIIMQKQAGAMINQAMRVFAALKRTMLQGGKTNNVLTVGADDKVETLNMQNLDGAAGFARTNIIKNIATAADMPAVMLENETLTEGFGEGTEDAKIIAAYIDSVRKWMKPLYDFLDEIVMYRAWTPEFYTTIQAEFPEQYGAVEYKTAFMQWRNSFEAPWPNLLKEAPSELVKVDEIKLKALVSLVTTLAPNMDPSNIGILLQWVCDNLNTLKLMFPNPLELDIATLVEWAEEKKAQEDKAASAALEGGGAGKPAMSLANAA